MSPRFRVSNIPDNGVSNLDAFSDGLRVLTTILVERRRARRRHRARHSAPEGTNRDGTGSLRLYSYGDRLRANALRLELHRARPVQHTPGKIIDYPAADAIADCGSLGLEPSSGTGSLATATLPADLIGKVCLVLARE